MIKPSLSTDKIIRDTFRKILKYRIWLILASSVALILFTINYAINSLEIERDGEYYDELRDKVIFIRFDERVVEKIRNLDKNQERIESNFEKNRNNPFN